MSPVNAPRSHGRTGFSLVEFLTVVAIAVIAFAVLTPAVQRSRADARRTRCANSLKQLGLALHNYHDVHKTMPPGWTNHHPKPGEDFRFGWQAFILPFVDQIQLYEPLDFDAPAQTDKKLLSMRVDVYRCPSDATPDTNELRDDYGTSNYSGNFGAQPLPRLLPGRMARFWPGRADTPMGPGPRGGDGLFWLNSRVGFRDITDGASNTFMVGERCVTSASGIWPGVAANDYENDQITDCSHASRLNESLTAFSSRHAGGANFLICDGSVRFVSGDVESSDDDERPGLYQILAGRADGMPVREF